MVLLVGPKWVFMEILCPNFFNNKIEFGTFVIRSHSKSFGFEIFFSFTDEEQSKNFNVKIVEK